MVTAYSWHPGACCVAPRWAIPVPVFPDEIISSWLVRAALAQGCDPLALTGVIWPKWRAWTQDTDRAIAEKWLSQLALVSGISTKHFQAGTLQAVASCIQGGLPSCKAIWPWILALGARNTKRRSGQQYCPMCISTDTIPYFRLHWRFAWQTGCEWHNCTLADRCWNCDAPLEPHRLMADAFHVAICPTCKADLRDTKSERCPVNAMAFQREVDRVVHEQRGQILGRWVTVKAWFEVADFFVSLIRRANRSGTGGLMSLIDNMGVSMPQAMPSVAGAALELLRVRDRQGIFEAAWYFLAADKGSFEHALKESGITQQGLCGKGVPVPSLVAGFAESLPNKPVSRRRRSTPGTTSPRPRHEVLRMMARLERRLEMTLR